MVTSSNHFGSDVAEIAVILMPERGRETSRSREYSNQHDVVSPVKSPTLRISWQ
jgi:hypothetical protein